MSDPTAAAASDGWLSSPLQRLRVIGFVEGVSFVLLLFVAMPLKYGFDMPGMVRVVGMAHGVLWILYVVAALHASAEREWPFGRLLLAGVASVLPFGPFVFDRSLAAEHQAARAADGADTPTDTPAEATP